MKFENTKVWGFESALRGMRNAKNSWDKNDTIEKVCKNDPFDSESIGFQICQKIDDNLNFGVKIGPNDLKLAQTLIRAGSEHRKFLRQIFVSVDITAPLYW